MTEPAATREEFLAVLESTLGFGPSYRVPSGLWLSSHLPMALHALHRLGAPRSALERHREAWAPRLPAVEGPGPAPVEAEDYLRILRALQAEAAGATADELVARRLPVLLEKPHAAAFHGPIRLAHAIEGGHAGEVLRALAAWESSRTHPLLAAAPAAAAAELDGASTREVLRRARSDDGLRFAPRTGTTIVSDMVAAAALDAFEGHAADFAPGLDALAEASLAAWLSSRDFTALHLVTGTRAIGVLLARFAPPPEVLQTALARTRRAWLAAWVSIGSPEPDFEGVHAGKASEADWQRRLPALHGARDDHAIKLADASREEWRARGWPGYARCVA